MPTSPLSLQSLAPLLSLAPIARSNPRWGDHLDKKLGELGIDRQMWEWQAELHASPPRNAPMDRFMEFLERLPLDFFEPSPEPVPTTVEEAFLLEELQAFIDRTDDLAQARNTLLATLGLPPESLARIHELCFIPGVLFECCLTSAEWAEQAHPKVRKQQQSLRSLKAQVQRNPLLSETLKDQMRREADVLNEFLQLEFPPLDKIANWRKQFGIDKQLHLNDQKHIMWGQIFVELVRLIRPYCSGPKKKYLQDNPDAIPTKAIRIASRLMHLSYPDRWPAGPKAEKAVENHVWSRKKSKA